MKTIKMSKQEEMMFNAFYDEEKGSEKSQTHQYANKPTKNQLATIEKLAKQKKITINQARITTYDDAYAYIGELIKTQAKKPASEKQIERIKEYCDIIGMSYPNFDLLEGGMNGTASQLIQKLKEKVDNTPRPASEKQVNLIVRMQLCPDCEVVENPQTMTIQEASEYINKYNASYYEWTKNMLSEGQQLRILQLNCMIEGYQADAQTENTRNENPVADVVGNPELSVKDKIKMLLPRQSMSFSSLVQITKEFAPKFIEQLESEYKAKCWQETTLEPEEMRGIKTTEDDDSQDKQYIELARAVTLLYAGMGQEVEPNFVETLQVINSNESFAKEESINKLKDLVDFSRLWGTDVTSIIEDITTMDNDIKMELLA